MTCGGGRWSSCRRRRRRFRRAAACCERRAVVQAPPRASSSTSLLAARGGHALQLLPASTSGRRPRPKNVSRPNWSWSWSCSRGFGFGLSLGLQTECLASLSRPGARCTKYLTIILMPKLRSTYDGRLIYRTSHEERIHLKVRFTCKIVRSSEMVFEKLTRDIRRKELSTL